MRSPILLLAMVLASSAHAEVFRYTDKNGNVVYTDEPRQGAERISVEKIPTVNLSSEPRVEKYPNRSRSEQPLPNDSGYRRLFFAEPEDNSAFWSGSGNIILAVDAEPDLKNSHRYEVLLDGESLGRNNTGIFSVEHIDRGTHTATVRVVRDDGEALSAEDEVVQEGQTVTFTVHRPSVLN